MSGIQFYNNNRQKIWKVVSENRLLSYDDNNGYIVVDSATPVTLTITPTLPAGFSCTLVKKGAGSVTIAGVGVTIAGPTILSAINERLHIDSPYPKLFLTDKPGSSGGGGGGGNTRKFTQANFADATNLNDAWLLGKDLAVFMNDIPKYLDVGTDYTPTGTGIQITIPGFDATANNYTFFITDITVV